MARQGKAFGDVSGGLHASEVAGAQHTIKLAYALLSSAEEPKTKAILDDVILFLWPSLNPDGGRRVAAVPGVQRDPGVGAHPGRGRLLDDPGRRQTQTLAPTK